MKTPVEVIEIKKRGENIAQRDLEDFLAGYMQGSVADYQMSAFLMAACIKGLSEEEVVTITSCIKESGNCRPKENFGKPVIDKHSTGGVGDKPTIVLLPLLASMGVLVPTLAGRGLGHTGGTVDKLEAIPGLKQQYSWADAQKLLERNGAAFLTQSDDIARLDKRLYALRDVTGTVDSIGLITSSILGKKLSEELDGLVLDVKYGSGAFMPTYEDAQSLASLLMKVSTFMGTEAKVLLTDMNEPLGEWAGNGVEVMEALMMLRGKAVERRFYEVTISLAEAMYQLAFPTDSRNVRERLVARLQSGKAYEKFLDIITAQGVAKETADNLDEILAPPELIGVVRSDRAGYVSEVNAHALGTLLIKMGAGRRVLSDGIDHKPGLRFLKKRGDKVDSGEALMEVYASKEIELPHISEIYTITDEDVKLPPYVNSLEKS
ncbi:thymidine phosphorylase [bacterium]|nr:thymidine phosphorylase [bacterium]